MPRPKKGTVEVVEPDIDQKKFEKASQKLPTLARQTSEVLQKIGYDEPYDRERVVQETRFYMGQSAEAMLEAGRRLIALKENEPHGDFVGIIEDRLGMSVRTAQVMMQAAAKYLLNPTLEANTQALAHLGSTKLFELMTESNDDLAELAEGGTLAGHTLDEIDRMTTRELKAALKEAKEELGSKEELLDKKNKQIDRMAAQQKRLNRTPPDEKLQEMQKEAQSFFNECAGMIRGTLRHALVELQNYANVEGMDCDAFLAGLVAQLKNDCADLQLEMGLADIETGKAASFEWLNKDSAELDAQVQAEYGERMAALAKQAGE